MSSTTLTLPHMDKPPSKYDVTVRVGKDDGHQPDPATFAIAASTAASRRNASVVSAHTRPRKSSASSAWPRQGPAAVAVALAVVADALRAADPVPLPSR